MVKVKYISEKQYAFRKFIQIVLIKKKILSKAIVKGFCKITEKKKKKLKRRI